MRLLESKKGDEMRKTIKTEPILKTSENDGMIDSISSAADMSRRMSEVSSPRSIARIRPLGILRRVDSLE